MIRLTASLWTAAFFVGCVAVPLAALLARAGGAPSLLLDAGILRVAALTAGQAALSTLLAVAFGLPLGLLAARATGRARAVLDPLLLVPSAVPTVVAATAWVAWLGRSGILARAGVPLDLGYSLAAVVLAHVFYNAPWVALLVANARRAMPEAPFEAARTLGAGRLSVLRHVTWPGIAPALGAAGAQAQALCSMSFALVLILGGGPPVETLETALYARVRFGSLDLAGAAACAAWELVLTLAPWAAIVALARGRRAAGASSVAADRRGARARGGWLAVALAGLFVVPYLAVFWGSESLALLGSAAFWSAVSGPLQVSARLAACVGAGTLLTAAAAVLALASAGRLRGAVAVVLALPSGLSALVLGLGGWLAYSAWIDPFEGSFAAIALLQATLFFPVAFRMLWPVAQAGNRARLDAAATLGASPWRAFWLVDWPRWRAPAAAAFGLVAASAMGEVAAVSLFYSERLVPLPLLVSRWMGQYRFEAARAASLVLLGVAVAAVCAVGGLRGLGAPVRRD